jgi:hypothetical protein
MRIFDDITSVDVPVLTDGQLYLYVLENQPQGNVKIGRSSNMQQRLRALSGSNSGGNRIVRCAVSDATWLYTLERIVHNKFREYRIDGTEWFSGTGCSFTDACEYIDFLFQSQEYAVCNQTRENFVKQHGMMFSNAEESVGVL